MASASELPFSIKNVTEEEDTVLKKYYKGYTRPFVRVGPRGYLLTPGYADHAADIYNLEVRPDDRWVVTFSRSGTTWLQELAWLVDNDLDYTTAENVPLSKRFAFIEYPTQASDIKKSTPNTKYKGLPTEHDFTDVHTLPSPRYFKTHLPFSLLPPKLLDAKVMYVARDVRDVAVSFFFMHKLFRYFDDDVEFKEYWKLFKKDLLFHMPIFPHIEEAWRKRHHPNVLFTFYEEMQKDLRGVVDKVCIFLGKEYTSEQKDALVKHLSFDNMNKSSADTQKGNDSEMKFLRKGKSGNWINYFDEQMTKEAEEYIQKHLQDTDLRFPDASS
ncbi:sulfotransferase 1C2-like [Pectinophora gossypiella]|uniref:sulfotransferase 1C2-like n=1 Tax=Pectinophora gossypiella TaxID=13191 RepID=UPI00214F4741|nr:sulfotransferase 1C2-like [Pectinophora gossypiella]